MIGICSCWLFEVKTDVGSGVGRRLMGSILIGDIRFRGVLVVEILD